MIKKNYFYCTALQLLFHDILFRFPRVGNYYNGPYRLQELRVLYFTVRKQKQLKFKRKIFYPPVR